VEEQAFDNMLERLLQQDFSAGTEEFRDELLARCLTVLDAEDDVAVLDDGLLDMLAAAGDPHRAFGETPGSGEMPTPGQRL
jgi:hypothetical protein